MFEGGEMVFSNKTTDAYGHVKLGGAGSDAIETEHGAFEKRLPAPFLLLHFLA
jgi:hypothetical protein